MKKPIKTTPINRHLTKKFYYNILFEYMHNLQKQEEQMFILKVLPGTSQDTNETIQLDFVSFVPTTPYIASSH